MVRLHVCWRVFVTWTEPVARQRGVWWEKPSLLFARGVFGVYRNSCLCPMEWSRLVMWSLKKKRRLIFSRDTRARLDTWNWSHPNNPQVALWWLVAAQLLTSLSLWVSGAWRRLKTWNEQSMIWISLCVCSGAARSDTVWDGAAASYCAGIQRAAERRLLSDVCLFSGSGVLAVNVTQAAAVVSAGNLIFVIIAVLFVFPYKVEIVFFVFFYLYYLLSLWCFPVWCFGEWSNQFNALCLKKYKVKQGIPSAYISHNSRGFLKHAVFHSISNACFSECTLKALVEMHWVIIQSIYFISPTDTRSVYSLKQLSSLSTDKWSVNLQNIIAQSRRRS